VASPTVSACSDRPVERDEAGRHHCVNGVLHISHRRRRVRAPVK
jgi:hypothetical protein